MARIKGRQARTGVSSARLLQVRVSPENRDAADVMAERLGISLAAYIDAVLTHAHQDVGADGRPSWWSEPVPGDQLEVPLSA